MSIEKRILVIGLNCLDLVHFSKNFPNILNKEWNEKGHWQRGGRASNICTVIKNLGGNVEYFGPLSESKGFTALIEDLKNKNIIIENCFRTNLDPPFSSIIFNETNMHKTSVVYLSSDYPYVKLENLKKLNLKNYNWIHWEGIFFDDTLAMINHVHEFNQDNPNDKIKLSIDIDVLDDNLLKLANNIDYVIVSQNFAMFHEYNSCPEATRGLRERIENKDCTIVIQWADQGTGILKPDNKFEIVELYHPLKIIDTLGAEDVFIGATLYSLSQGNSISIAASYGNKVSGYKLQKFGFDNIKELVSCAMECCVPTCDCCQSCSK